MMGGRDSTQPGLIEGTALHHHALNSSLRSEPQQAAAQRRHLGEEAPSSSSPFHLIHWGGHHSNHSKLAEGEVACGNKQCCSYEPPAAKISRQPDDGAPSPSLDAAVTAAAAAEACEELACRQLMNGSTHSPKPQPDVRVSLLQADPLDPRIALRSQQKQQEQDPACNLSPEWRAAAEAHITAARMAAAAAVASGATAAGRSHAMHQAVQAVQAEDTVESKRAGACADDDRSAPVEGACLEPGACADGDRSAPVEGTCLEQYGPSHTSLKAESTVMMMHAHHNTEATSNQGLCHQQSVYQGFPIYKEALFMSAGHEQPGCEVEEALMPCRDEAGIQGIPDTNSSSQQNDQLFQAPQAQDLVVYSQPVDQSSASSPLHRQRQQHVWQGTGTFPEPVNEASCQIQQNQAQNSGHQREYSDAQVGHSKAVHGLQHSMAELHQEPRSWQPVLIPGATFGPSLASARTFGPSLASAGTFGPSLASTGTGTSLSQVPQPTKAYLGQVNENLRRCASDVPPHTQHWQGVMPPPPQQRQGATCGSGQAPELHRSCSDTQYLQWQAQQQQKRQLTRSISTAGVESSTPGSSYHTYRHNIDQAEVLDAASFQPMSFSALPDHPQLRRQLATEAWIQKQQERWQQQRQQWLTGQARHQQQHQIRMLESRGDSLATTGFLGHLNGAPGTTQAAGDKEADHGNNHVNSRVVSRSADHQDPGQPALMVSSADLFQGAPVLADNEPAQSQAGTAAAAHQSPTSLPSSSTTALPTAFQQAPVIPPTPPQLTRQLSSKVIRSERDSLLKLEEGQNILLGAQVKGLEGSADSVLAQEAGGVEHYSGLLPEGQAAVHASTELTTLMAQERAGDLVHEVTNGEMICQSLQQGSALGLEFDLLKSSQDNGHQHMSTYLTPPHYLYEQQQQQQQDQQQQLLEAPSLAATVAAIELLHQLGEEIPLSPSIMMWSPATAQHPQCTTAAGSQTRTTVRAHTCYSHNAPQPAHEMKEPEDLQATPQAGSPAHTRERLVLKGTIILPGRPTTTQLTGLGGAAPSLSSPNASRMLPASQQNQPPMDPTHSLRSTEQQGSGGMRVSEQRSTGVMVPMSSTQQPKLADFNASRTFPSVASDPGSGSFYVSPNSTEARHANIFHKGSPINNMSQPGQSPHQQFPGSSDVLPGRIVHSDQQLLAPEQYSQGQWQYNQSQGLNQQNGQGLMRSGSSFSAGGAYPAGSGNHAAGQVHHGYLVPHGALQDRPPQHFRSEGVGGGIGGGIGGGMTNMMELAGRGLIESQLYHPAGLPQRSPSLAGGSRRRQRENLPKGAVAYLKRWLFCHVTHPYPTEQEKSDLAQSCGDISLLQKLEEARRSSAQQLALLLSDPNACAALDNAAHEAIADMDAVEDMERQGVSSNIRKQSRSHSSGQNKQAVMRQTQQSHQNDYE
ncbi:hypothetical protein CEUSTIGMA_g5651.t1 [Chlamydomonas eustigma]|uniref:KN homeodomain domain-containing protein n=1 Tax=Chlamydomonas eustigma TaxID=1157962 RepID=A0A250X5L4_9CHLO|nr:hypothetical protein CEUSTIGMA_g5651.t1 [Chlamydomonas eustigma]|eukprot:GAX78209.1 hypothetical protein CEUSTIGMA_g5651.t1 [Chlamydomonas eustigma]